MATALRKQDRRQPGRSVARKFVDPEIAATVAQVREDDRATKAGRDVADLAQQLATLLANHPGAWQLAAGVNTSGGGAIFAGLQPGGPSGFVTEVSITVREGARVVHAESIPLACPCHGSPPGGAA